MLQRFHLAILAVAAVLPVLAFAAVMVVLFDGQKQEAVEVLMRQTARSAIGAIDRKLATDIAALTALSASREIDSQNLPELYEEMRRVLGSQDDWLAIWLADGTTRRRLIDTSLPPGTELPSVKDTAGFDTVLHTRRPLIGGVRMDESFGGEPYVLLRVPVLREGLPVRYTLSVAVRARTFTQALIEQGVPEGWLASVVDGDQRIVGRTRAAAAFVGALATPSVAEAIRKATETFFFALTKEGERAYTVVKTSPFSRWTICLGAPADIIEQPRRRSLIAITAVGIGAALLALLTSAILIRSYARRQEAERRLSALEAERTAERRLTDIAANLPGLIYRRVRHPDGAIRYPYLSDGAPPVPGIDHLFVSEDRVRHQDAMAESAGTLTPYRLEARLERPDGTVRWVRSMAHTHRGPDGSIIWDGVMLDITDLKETEARLGASLAEKETLLREIHHRVKNNLQVIWSLIHLESMQVQDTGTRERLEVVGQRVNVLGRIHEQLYSSDRFDRIDLGRQLESLCLSLAELHRSGNVTISVEAEPLFCDLDTAIPLGLVANELVGNSLKHAFPNGRPGSVRVLLRPAAVAPGQVELVVADDGVGLSASDRTAGNHLGLRLIDALVGQVDARIRFESETGTRVTILLPGDRFTG